MSFPDDQLKAFVGQGMVFPLQLDNGRVRIVTGFELINSSLKIILSWPKFTRYLLHKFGSNYQLLLNNPNDVTTAKLVKEYTVDAINQWEPRIELLASKVIEQTDYMIKVELTYRIKNTQLENTLIFPYYTSIPY